MIASGYVHSNMLDAALGYARRGWRVLPLHWVGADGRCSCGAAPSKCKPGKHPHNKLVRHGVKDATTDTVKITAWWERYPRCNLGLGTGPESGIWCLGPDGQQGLNDLAELQRQHGSLPRTVRARSGSGGEHWVFAWPASGTISNRVNHQGLAIDVRGQGGYFVVAPSTNANGSYSWIDSPESTSIAKAPPWLVEWVRTTKSKATHEANGHAGHGRQSGRPVAIDRARRYLAKCKPAISGQRGHDATFEIARAVVYGFDLGAEAGFDLLWNEYNPKCVPPWSEQELRHKCIEADTVSYDRPRGYLLGDGQQEPPRPSADGKAGAGQQGHAGSESASAEQPEPGLTLTRLDNIKPEPIKWLIPSYLPLGKLTLLAGPGEQGKSMTIMHVAACVSTGTCALGLTYSPPPPGEVLLCCMEDSFADTICPRLLAAGADLGKIFRVDGLAPVNGVRRAFTLENLLEVEAELRHRPNVRLLAIDPLGSYLGQGIDDAKDAQVRAILDPLQELAGRYNVAVLALKHVNKNTSAARAIDRVGGSVAFVNAARVCHLVAIDPEDSTGERRFLIPLKANIVKKPSALAFGIERVDTHTAVRLAGQWGHLDAESRQALREQLVRVRWDGQVQVNVEDVLGAIGKKDKGPNKVDQCADWLREFLGQYAYPSHEIEAAAAEEGFTRDNVFKAKAKLKGDGLRNSCKGFQGMWWAGFGDPTTWVRRPDLGAPHDSHKSHESHDSGPSVQTHETHESHEAGGKPHKSGRQAQAPDLFAPAEEEVLYL